MMKILIVDDHDLVRGGLRALLETQGHLVLDARGGEEALELISANTDFDAVFLDLNMPHIGGIEAIMACRTLRPQLPIIVLSSSEDPQDVRRVIGVGAMGYLPKTASTVTLISALTMVMQGDLYIPPIILNDNFHQAQTSTLSEGNTSIGNLTSRQMDVLQLVTKGMSNKEIARALSLSEKTIKIHMSGIFRALSVVNRTQAVAAAQRANLT